VYLEDFDALPPQIVEALCLLLPDSSYYPVLSNLPEPDLTNPAATALFSIQSVVHNSLPILEEIVDLVERDEVESVKKEVESRRLRLDETRGPDLLRKAVELEILGTSQVRIRFVSFRVCVCVLTERTASPVL
jgi:superkiller protein 3